MHDFDVARWWCDMMMQAWRCYMMMLNDDDIWWCKMMMRYDDARWWCKMMMHYDAQCWRRMIMHDNGDAWWLCMMMMHDDDHMMIMMHNVTLYEKRRWPLVYITVWVEIPVRLLIDCSKVILRINFVNSQLFWLRSWSVEITNWVDSAHPVN